jgi:hypothetical protein
LNNTKKANLELRKSRTPSCVAFRDEWNSSAKKRFDSFGHSVVDPANLVILIANTVYYALTEVIELLTEGGAVSWKRSSPEGNGAKGKIQVSYHQKYSAGTYAKHCCNCVPYRIN